jgi:hypothetical protein
VLLGLGLALATAQPAGAATTVGQVSMEVNPNNCPPATIFVTTAVSAGTAFTVPAGGGVITSWQTNAGSGSGGTDAKLKVFRATGDPNQFLVVGQSALEPITASSLNGPFPARIPVQAGDYVSIRPGNNGGPCDTSTGNMADSSRVSQGGADTPDGSTTLFNPTPNTAQRANVSASLEADADGDGFGDETQDNCLGAAGPLNGCPRPDADRDGFADDIADLCLNLPGPINGCPDNNFQIGAAISKKNGFAELTVTVPGAGTVQAQDAATGLSRLAGTAKKKGKQKGRGLIKPVTVQAAAAGRVTLILKPTSTARKKLAKKGRVSVNVRVTFTPTRFTPKSAVVPVTLSKKRPKVKK